MKQVIILCVVIFMASCGRNIEQPSKPGVIPKIKSVTNSGGGSTTYEHDSRGRVITVVNSDGSKNTYTYSGDSAAVQKNYDNSGNLTGQAFYELYHDYAEKVTYGGTSRTTFLYNIKGQLVNQHSFIGPLSDSSDFFYYYSPEGRLDSMWSTRNNNTTIIYKQYYEYAINKPNTTSFINRGLLYMGAERNANPPSKVTTVYPSAPQRVDNFSYEYDSGGRIVKETYNGASYATYTYY